MYKIVNFNEISERFDVRYHTADKLNYSSLWFISDLKDIVVRDPNCYDFKYSKIGIPIIRISDLKEPFIDFTKAVKITQEIHNKFSKTHLKPFDILVSVRGVSTGKVSIFLGEFEECNISPNLIIIRLKDVSLAPYVTMFLLSNNGQSQIQKMISGAGKPSLTAPMIDRIQIPIPSSQQLNQINKLFEQAKEKRLHSNTIKEEINNIFEKYFNSFQINKKIVTIRKIDDLKDRWDAHYNNQAYLDLRNFINNYDKLKKKTISELTDCITDTFSDFDNKKQYGYIEIGSINNISGIIEDPLFDYPELLPENGKIQLVKQDILISKVRPYLNGISIFNNESNDFFASKNGFAVYRPTKASYPFYITAFLRFRIGLYQIIMLQGGTSYPTVSENDIHDINILFLNEEDTLKINELYKEYVSIKEVEEYTKSTILDLLNEEELISNLDIIDNE